MTSKEVNLPTTNKEFWDWIKSLPMTLQFLFSIMLVSSVIDIPDSFRTIFNIDPTIKAIEATTDSLGVRLSGVESKLSIAEIQHGTIFDRLDTLTENIAQQSETVDYLWCINERIEFPEVRVFCAELREAVRQYQRLRAGVR